MLQYLPCLVRRTATSKSFSRPTLLLMAKSRARHSGKPFKHTGKRWKGNAQASFEGTNDQVLLADIKLLLSKGSSDALSSPDGETLLNKVAPQIPGRWSEIEVQISEISSTGDGLGHSQNSEHIYVVPFSLPGDTVKAKVVRTHGEEDYSETDFLGVVRAGPMRNDSLVRCQYFSKCSGCQFQTLSYDDQLAHKKRVIEKAYRNFSGLKSEAIPSVDNVIGSPLQYGYRTKLTPHFPQKPKVKSDGVEPQKSKPRPIGFIQKGMKAVMDVEDCPIGTDVVRKGFKVERERVQRTFDSFEKGATLLLRESTKRVPAPSASDSGAESSRESSTIETEDAARFKPLSELKTCITDNNAMSTEYVEEFIFKQQAGQFFQNNNSILPRFTQYVREKIVSSSLDAPLDQLIDAYCGSGLFTVVLSSAFESSIGIDISPGNIENARRNAELNGIKNASSITATASAIFDSLPKDAEPDRTAVVIDPPRKGCGADFLRQLLRFRPRRIVYVSCNCHTQARDVGVLVEGAGPDARYKIESICGFDFFPQTSHVESVAVLQRAESQASQ